LKFLVINFLLISLIEIFLQLKIFETLKSFFSSFKVFIVELSNKQLGDSEKFELCKLNLFLFAKILLKCIPLLIILVLFFLIFNYLELWVLFFSFKNLIISIVFSLIYLRLRGLYIFE